MKLLVLTPEYRGSGGGIFTLYRALLPALRQLDVQVRVIEGSGMHAVHDPAVRDEDGITTEILDRARLDRFHGRLGHLEATPMLRLQLAAAWGMWEQAGHGADCDIVEACDFGLTFVPAAVEAGRPLVVQCHGSLGQLSVHDPIAGGETDGVLFRLIEQAVLRDVQAVQTYSAANASFWQSQTGRHVMSFDPGLDLPLLAAGPISGRGIVVGRVQRWKGPDVLCAALERLGDRAPHLDWVGRDMSWSEQAKSSSAHLAEAYPTIWGRIVRPSPPVPPAEVARRQAQALFNVVPSTWDVFNFTAAEAMAAGRPTIVSTGAGASELVESGRNGYVFPSRDDAALAATIDEIARETPERLRAIGAAGRETVARRLNVRTSAERHLTLYRDLIERHGTSPAMAPPSWVSEACRPAATSDTADFRFLDAVPLRTLMKHVAHRSGHRVLAQLRRQADG